MAGAQRISVKLAAHASGEIFADAWAAMAIGTMCRRLVQGVTVVTWGSPDWMADVERNSFAQSLPGLVSLQMANSVVTERNASVDRDSVERFVSLKKRGVIELGGGTTRALVEFDPQQSIAIALQDERSRASPHATERRLFGELLLQFRSELEIGAISRGYTAQETGAIKALTTFLAELHDNAYEHGRTTLDRERPGNGIRVLRLRKHVATNRDELLKRAGSIKPLHDYLSTTTRGGGPQAVIEAVVSDFGPGIVDHFLESPEGHAYRDVDRRTLLDRLMFERLTAKGADLAAGLGISNALKAARELACFVGLRTSEFWLARSYAEPGAFDRLFDIHEVPRVKVAGTHWQFIWPQPV